MKSIASIFLLISSIFFVNAQDARTILDKANKAYDEAGGIIASFSVETEDEANKTTYSQDGTAYLKRDKFQIEVTDGITWFDGKTQWVYAKGSDEVNVSNPEGEELASVSPSILFKIYKSGFNLINRETKQENGKSVYVVELVPQKKNPDFKKMTVCIDKKSYIFTSIKITGTNRINNKLIIKKIQLNKGLDDKLFIFDKKTYPNVEIIDLR